MPTFGGFVVATSGAPAEDRRAFSDIIDELARPVNAGDSTVRALAADAFRAAVRTMNRRGNWPWEIQEEDVTIAANNSFSSVVSVIKKPLAMHLLSAAGGVRDQRIVYLSYERFMQVSNQNISSQAWYYTVPNLFETGQIQWWPIHSSADNARFTFYRVTPAPRQETETVEIPDYAIEAYMACAWYEFLKRLPSEQRPFPIAIALSDRRDAFREISAQAASTGDVIRQVSMVGLAT